MFWIIMVEHANTVCAKKQKSLLERTVNYCTTLNHTDRQGMKPDLHNMLYIYILPYKIILRTNKESVVHFYCIHCNALKTFIGYWDIIKVYVSQCQMTLLLTKH